MAVTFGSLLTSLGYILMKRSHEVARIRKISNYLTFEFIFGFTMCLVSGAVSAVSLAFADMILLSSLSGLTIVFNSIFAITIQREKFCRYDVGCIILTVIGASLCVSFSNYKESRYSTKQMTEFIISYQSLLLIGCYVTFIIASTLYKERIFKEVLENKEHIQNLIKDDVAQFYRGSQKQQLQHDKLTTSTTLHALLGLHPQLYPEDKAYSKNRLKVPLIILSWQSGIFSGLATIFIKCFEEAIKTHYEFKNMWNPVTYFFLIFAIIFLILQLRTFNQAFRFYDQLEVVPIYQSSIIINGIACGAIIMNELRFYGLINIIMICVGTLISTLGILLTLLKHQTKTECQINQSFNLTEENGRGSDIENVDLDKNRASEIALQRISESQESQ